MQKRAALGVTVCLASLLQSQPVSAQDRASADAAIDSMRRETSVGQSDQQRIRAWVAIVIEELKAAPADQRIRASVAFRDMFRSQLNNTNNTPGFRSQLVAQTSAVATTHFTDPNITPTLAAALARVLLDMDAIESVPGLMAGLACKVDAARHLAVRAIILQQRAIAADNARLPGVIQSLQTAGVTESSSVVLSRIYKALAFPGQSANVIDAYLAILDKRLTNRRASNVADGAELEALLYFSDAAALNALNQSQKAQLVARVAVLLRLDAARYDNALLAFGEIDILERSLVQSEELLKAATNAANGGDVAGILNQAGRTGMATIPAEAAKWVGDAAAGSSGALNAAPWNVPVGAP